jgi:hypothetical protein
VEQVPETGGPVYPGKAMDVFEMNERGQLELVYSSGITLRDHFAGLAMQSMLAREDARFSTTLEFVGGKAYQYADAMLKARK